MDISAHASLSHQSALLQTLEENQRSILNAMEWVLEMGERHKREEKPFDVEAFLELTIHHIYQFIPFEVQGIYLVDQTTSDIQLHCCHPSDKKSKLSKQMAFLIDNGYIAWALREQRGLVIYSNDVRNRIMLHVIASPARIRGLFIGLFPVKSKRLATASRQALSLMLRNTANALENVEYMEMYQRQNVELLTKVDQKVGELRRHDMQLLNAQKMDAIATLAGGIAHQFNNALFALTGSFDLIRIEFGNNQKVQNYLDRANTIAQKMNGLTLKLLAYARGGKYNMQRITIEALVEKAVRDLSTPIDNKTQLVVQQPCEPCFVNVDVMQMEMTIAAIVTNALESIESGGQIQINWHRPAVASPVQNNLQSDVITLEISDNGRGMDDQTQQRIFEPFFSTKFQGRGLSMAAVHGIVQNHQGTITIESEIGKGTTVQINLPADR